MKYLTLDQIKKHLNIDNDFTEDDSYLESLETVSVELIQKHIDHSLNLLEVDGQLPLSLQQGILLCIGNFYNNRESVAYASTHEIPSNLQWILDLYQYYDSTSESGGDSDVEKKITELETKIKELVNAIESKADQSTIDTLTTTINTLSTDVSSLSNTVSTKLDTTTFTDYQTTVDTKFDNIEKEMTKAGKIDDVQVNGQSVVEDKVAKIDLTSYATSDTISSLNTRITQDEVQINTVSSQVTKLDDRVTTIKDSIPTKTSQLTNDSGFLTSHQSLADYAKTADVNTALAKKADTTAIPTKVSQLENDVYYVKEGEGIFISNSGEIEMESKDGVNIILSTWTNEDDDLTLLNGFFVYPYDGNPYITSDFNIKNGSILTLDDNSTISLFGSDDKTLNISSSGLSLGDGSATKLFSSDGKTYDIASLESKVSTNATAISTINTTIGNIDTLLTTILNG